MMEEKDLFKNWVKKKLEEETKEIVFSAEARERVRRSVLDKGTTNQSNGILKRTKQVPQPQWWNREVSFSLRVVSFCMAFLFIAAAFYTRTFFYISPQQIAKFETREKIILQDDGVPFGALQHMVASLDKGKGVGRP